MPQQFHQAASTARSASSIASASILARAARSRQKIFGMVCVPLDRNQKAKLMHRARCLMRATEKGRHYGPITAKCYAVLCALLIGFHNNATGRC
jgi:hypothetical protein